MLSITSDILILTELLKNGNDFCSGNDLACKLGVSRVSIWSRLEKLRKEGFVFEAIRNRGYRILEEPPFPHEALIHAYSNIRKLNHHFLFFKNLDTTMNEAQRQIASGAPLPLAVIARNMTECRGRRGRKWFTSDRNIYVTFAFNPRLLPSELEGFTLWMGICFCKLLRSHFNLPIQLKWPNDLYLHGKKLAGMLTEVHIESDYTHDLTFGLGINVDPNMSTWPEEIREIATAINQYTEHKININHLMVSVLETGFRAYNEYLNGAWSDSLVDEWKRLDSLWNKPVTALHQGMPFSGIAKGINSRGHLLLEKEDNSIISIPSGDVTLAKDPILQTAIFR